MNHWQSTLWPPMRCETLFGDRVFDCFAERSHSIYALWYQWVECQPDRHAVVDGDVRWTYAQADDQVRSIAQGLAAQGISQGDRVALLMNNHALYVFCVLALQCLGAIAVPIGTREQQAGVTYMLNQCEARGIVFDVAFSDRLPEAAQAPALSLRVVNGDGVPGLRLEDLLNQGVSNSQQSPAPVDEEDTAIILYTSGTTGHPKGAMLTHVNVVHSARHLEASLHLTSRDRAALTVPISHVTGLVTVLLTTLSVGATCVIAPPFKAEAFLAFMEQEAITYTVLVPAMYSLCLQSPALNTRDLRHWRIGAYGGAPMAVQVIEDLARALPHLGLVNAYGATEATGPTSLSPIASDMAHVSSIGTALPCVQVRIMDDHGVEVPCGVDGELWIGGPATIPGYWNNPAATREAFTAGYWRSGDVGHVDAEGFLYLVDRKKDMLSRGGFKIYSLEVENRLMAYSGVVEAAIVGKPCPVLGERVHAFLYAPGLQPDTEALRRHCAETLTDYKVPESITWSAQPLPRNANGKVLKRILREHLPS
jgi:long-chain acyl-CoA synthetase